MDPGLIVNLDPAVSFLPYTPQIDIRDKIKIKKLMKSHKLGPNGAIMTALNLYCSEIDTVSLSPAAIASFPDPRIGDKCVGWRLWNWKGDGRTDRGIFYEVQNN